MALKASSSRELTETIEALLENRDNIRETLKEKREKNLGYYSKNLDGRASERVSDLILKTL